LNYLFTNKATENTTPEVPFKQNC